LDTWPQDHIPQEIRDVFLTLQMNTALTVQDEREGYATSLQDGLLENKLDAEVGDHERGTIITRLFFSDFQGQNLQSTTALLATFQLQSRIYSRKTHALPKSGMYEENKAPSPSGR
jgi:hypothetical protein